MTVICSHCFSSHGKYIMTVWKSCHDRCFSWQKINVTNLLLMTDNNCHYLYFMIDNKCHYLYFMTMINCCHFTSIILIDCQKYFFHDSFFFFKFKCHNSFSVLVFLALFFSIPVFLPPCHYTDQFKYKVLYNTLIWKQTVNTLIYIC